MNAQVYTTDLLKMKGNLYTNFVMYHSSIPSQYQNHFICVSCSVPLDLKLLSKVSYLFGTFLLSLHCSWKYNIYGSCLNISVYQPIFSIQLYLWNSVIDSCAVRFHYLLLQTLIFILVYFNAMFNLLNFLVYFITILYK